jgi:hypothetical protein
MASLLMIEAIGRRYTLAARAISALSESHPITRGLIDCRGFAEFPEQIQWC